MLVKDGRETAGCVMSEKDPAFDFPAPTPYDLHADVTEAVRYFGHVKLGWTDWLSEKLSEYWFNNPETQIARIGEKLAPFELHAVGAPHWQTIGDEAFSKLTDKGRALGVKAFEQTVQRACCRYFLAKEYAEMRRCLAMQLPYIAVTIRTTSPRRCCEHARALDGKLFSEAQALPTLPLAPCDFAVCGCAYSGVTAHEMERGD
jgi:hypothetical protein